MPIRILVCVIMSVCLLWNQLVAQESTTNSTHQSTDQTFSDTAFTAHIADLRKRLPAGDFQIVIQKPFVIIGDESAEMVEWRSQRTVKWAVDRIKQDYFDKQPNHIIDIWLFKDKTSYETNAEELFGQKPRTPYGYYSSSNRALVMNISTGGGTLVHEIVHPFIESNFPSCPSWFNEGLASLYEQCRDKDGHIWGSTNWRLRGLQIAIKSDVLPTFQKLTATTTREFYNEDSGTNYAQARYLCYYLQEKGLLVDYYKSFVANVEDDPTGYETLQTILKRTDMDRFQQEWSEFVSRLKYPE